MIKILFVCHGNICRSTMAEYMMKDLVDKEGLSDFFMIDSCAVSREEIGNSIYPQAKAKLQKEGIPVGNHRARQFTSEDYENFDYIVCMDESNMYRLMKMTNDDPMHKCRKLLSFVNSKGDVSDPWWNDDFDTAYKDINRGILGLFKLLKNNL